MGPIAFLDMKNRNAISAFPYFSCALNVRDRSVLVIGGSAEAMSKARALSRSGANVTVVGSNPSTSLLALARTHRWRVLPRGFQKRDLNGRFLVFLCDSGNETFNLRVFRFCRQKKILLCVIDRPDYCDVVNVSVMERGLLRIAVSTNGAAPRVSRAIRESLEAAFRGVPIERYLATLAALRPRVRRRISDPDTRRKLLVEAARSFRFQGRARLATGWERRVNPKIIRRKR